VSTRVQRLPSHSKDAQNLLARLGEPVLRDVAASEALLKEFLDSPYAYLRELTLHLERFWGKRLRPILLHLSARAFGGEAPLAREVAALVEMIHLASLCHDDVLDDAQTRRAAPTLNAQWGNKAAIVTGDLLFSRASERLGRLDDPRPFRLVSRAARLVCEGELLQIGARYNLRLEEREYLDILHKKTGALFGVAAQLGALLAGASEEDGLRMESYGRRLGVAFQIVDDCLDLTGVETTVGKSLGSDLRNGELTLPIIHHLANANPLAREELSLMIRPGSETLSRENLRPHLERTGSIAYSYQLARRELQHACEELEFLPQSSTRGILLEFPEYVLSRTS
jgi:geranylgeranyl pyrophosphate synthase